MDNKINERLYKIRKHFGSNQRDFASKIGISQPALAMFETGDRELKNIHIIRICEEFGINEAWLRTGEGGDDNMFTKLDPEDRFSINLGKLGATENKMAQNMINAIAEADPEKLEYIEEFMRACLGLDVKEKS